MDGHPPYRHGVGAGIFSGLGNHLACRTQKVASCLAGGRERSQDVEKPSQNPWKWINIWHLKYFKVTRILVKNENIKHAQNLWVGDCRTQKTWSHLVGAFFAESGVVVPVDTGENHTLSARSSEWTWKSHRKSQELNALDANRLGEEQDELVPSEKGCSFFTSIRNSFQINLFSVWQCFQPLQGTCATRKTMTFAFWDRPKGWPTVLVQVEMQNMD